MLALMAEARSGFRQARPSDAATIVAIVNGAFSGDGGTSGWTNEHRLFEGERTYAAEVLTLLAVPDSKFLLWIHEGKVAGCAYLRRFGNSAYMGMLAVRPVLQGIGVGKQIIAEVERIASEEMHCALMMIGVITSHRPDLAAFYERRGYARTGRTKPLEGSQARREKKAADVVAEWMEKRL